MKRRSFVYTIVTVLLLFATLFSVTFTVASHKDTCEHSVCETCYEMETAEQTLFELAKAHEACAEKSCETCVLLQEQLVILQEMQGEEHSCHTLFCDACLRTMVGKSMRTLAVLLAVFAIAYAVYCTAEHIIYQKKGLCQTCSLLSLKVRLNN